MILRLKENKKLSFYQKNPIYIGEKDFEKRGSLSIVKALRRYRIERT